MITLQTNMIPKDAPNMRVASPTGEYDDTALVECFDPEHPEIGYAMYQAQYIKYGNFVYYYNDPKELGAELLKIDPESTHTAASFVRMSNELLAQMNSGSLEGSTLESAINENQEGVIEEPAAEEVPEPAPPTESAPDPVPESVSDPEPVPEVVPEPIPTPEPEVVLPLETTTTTPSVLGTSTTTEAVPEIVPVPVVEESATTTPELISLLTKRGGRKRRA